MCGNLGYSLTTFNSKGLLPQVEYAKKAAILSNTIISIKTKKGIITGLKNDKNNESELDYFSSKFFLINKRIGIAGSGFSQDIKILVKRARTHCATYKQNFGEEISLRQLVRDLAGFIQKFTQMGGVRPFAAFLICMAFGKNGPDLYQIDPSGSIFKIKAGSVGKSGNQIKNFLKKRKIEGLSLKDAFNLILLAFRTNFETKECKSGFQFSVVSKSCLFRILDAVEVELYLR